MTDMENYLLSALFFIILCALFWLWQIRKKKKATSGKEQFIENTLDLAISQYEIFNLKLHDPGSARVGLSAMLREIDRDGLHLDVNDYVSEDWTGKQIDVFFRVLQDDLPVFYTFTSNVKQIKPDYGNSRVVIAMPQHLRVEKKRHFERVKPNKETVRVVGVWQIQPGKRLPKSASEIGPPLTHYRFGSPEEPVQVEDISASGLALRFALDKDSKAPRDFIKGDQLLCLVVYVLDNDDDKPIAFWCTGEIMNTRVAESPRPALVTGLEFTNWAVLEQGTNEIHWAHSSPSRGARPIMQWVQRIEAEKKKLA